MKTIQKWEIRLATANAIFISAFVYLLGSSNSGFRFPTDKFEIVLLIIFITFWLSSVMTAIGAFFHVKKQSESGFILLCVASMFVVIISGVCAVASGPFAVITGIPAILSIFTLTLAIYTRIRAIT